jgi:hypothetical protein
MGINHNHHFHSFEFSVAKKLSTEVTEILRALCVEALKGRRTGSITKMNLSLYMMKATVVVQFDVAASLPRQVAA